MGNRDHFLSQFDFEYMFLLTAMARDLVRFQKSFERLSEMMVEAWQVEAVKVDKKTGPLFKKEECERISVYDHDFSDEIQDWDI